MLLYLVVLLSKGVPLFAPDSYFFCVIVTKMLRKVYVDKLRLEVN